MTAAAREPSLALVAGLRRAGLVSVDDSARRRAEYASDASNYRVVPAAVAYPRHVEEVAAAVDVARDLGVPITSRGGGTSIAGNAVGSGLVLDFSRHLGRVLAVDPEARTAVVEPGAILDDITAAAAPHGLRFGPDPSTHARATIGGSLGNNACGSRALRYGRTADNVAAIDLLTASGAVMSARSFGREGLAAAGPLGVALANLVSRNLATIRTEFGRFTRQVSGYSLEHLLPENGSDLAAFLVGTEGTLGVITGATVALVDAPAATALAVLGYADMPAAADAVMALLPHKPVALEAMDSTMIELYRSLRGSSGVPDLPRGDAWLLVETAGSSAAEAKAAAHSLIADGGALDSLVATGAAARALFHIREDGAGLSTRTLDGGLAWPGWEDAAVPPEHLGAYLREFRALLDEYRLHAVIYGHLGDGCVHARIDFPLLKSPGVLRAFMEAAAALAGGYGGSMSGEHGDGRARGELLHYMYSPAALQAFAEVKAIFDPGNLFNPGVLVDPLPLDADLRVPAAKPLRGRHIGFAFGHDGGDLSHAVHRCVGIGKCRADNSHTPDGRGSSGVMCPSYQATRDEKDSTRGRARVLQELANGGLVKGFRDDAIRESLDLCLSCKGCKTDCPAGVDMATYKAEALYQRYRRRLRPASHYSLGWLPRFARIASHAPSLTNALLHNGFLASLAKRFGGIDQRRALPSFAAQTFRDWFAARPGQTKGGKPVLLWVDTFTNHFSPEVGRAAVHVLESAGYQVSIVERPVCCGLTWISTGQLDDARKQLRRSLAALSPALEAGTPIVGLEPSCTAVFRDDAAELLPEDLRALRAKTAMRTLAELLRDTPGWEPPDLSEVHAVAQPHCHQHAVMGWTADADLLARAGAHVEAVGGCCGLAGNFGVEKGHYDVSVAVSENALMPAVRAAPEGAVVLADGFSCRTQLTEVGRVHGIHLAQLLADSPDTGENA